MKPTFQISQATRQQEPRSARFNSSKSSTIEQSFQTSAPEMRGGPTSFSGESEGPTSRPHFWALSQGFFAAEAKREYRFEAVLFGIIIALSAWPIGLAWQAAAHLAK